jgi:hypothetical protein
MKYLKSYNEEILWSKKIRRLIKGVDKEDMYIRNTSLVLGEVKNQ